MSHLHPNSISVTHRIAHYVSESHYKARAHDRLYDATVRFQTKQLGV